MGRRRRQKGPSCPNCGTALRPEFEFCPHCGQENHDLRVPFKTFLYEFVENITHFDTKLWNTLKVIVTRPGLLTKDFVEGKRVRYVHPARFYIFTSVIFFALLTLHLDREVGGMDLDTTTKSDPYAELRMADLEAILPDSTWERVGPTVDVEQLSESLKDPLLLVRIPIDKPWYASASARLRTATPVVLDSLFAALETEPGDTLPGTRERMRTALVHLPVADSLNVCYAVAFNGLPASFCDRKEESLFRSGDLSDDQMNELLGAEADSVGWFKRRLLRSISRLDVTTTVGKQRLAHVFVRAVSTIMFLLMPFTAALLLWTFARKRYYWEHLIFSVHTHTIYFLFFIAVVLLALVTPGEWPGWVLPLVLLICLVYLFASLKYVYGHSWPRTLLRSFLMGIPYVLLFVLLLFAGFLWGFINL
jgi:hypothetical protein